MIRSEEHAIHLSQSKSKRKKGPGDSSEDESIPENRLRNRNKRTPKPEPVYIIPDVERKETTFRGRLGDFCPPLPSAIV